MENPKEDGNQGHSIEPPASCPTPEPSAATKGERSRTTVGGFLRASFSGGGYTAQWKKLTHQIVSAVTLVALLVTVALVGAYLIGVWWSIDSMSQIREPWLHLLFACWVILPPIAFWFEYYFMWEDERDTHAFDLDHFSYGQTQSRNMWLALSVVLGVICKGELATDNQDEGEPLKVMIVQPSESQAAETP